MRSWRRSCALLWLLTIGCMTAPESHAPGRGLLRFDAQPPSGARVWALPSYRAGDRFTLRRADAWQTTFEVVAADDGGYRIDNGGDYLLRLDRHFGRLGEWRRDGQPHRRLRPVDTRYHWPLWVGKTWSCEFVDHSMGRAPTSMRAEYRVEAVDRVAVPAGTFETLRIVRRLHRLTPSSGVRLPTRTQVLWLDPATGLEVRQLVDGSLIELVAHQR